MAYTAFKIIIDQFLYNNTTGDIEASEVNNLLKQLVDTVGTLQYRGTAESDDNPGSIDQNCFFFAIAGTYPNFGNLTIGGNKLGILKWIDQVWTKDEIDLGEDGELYDEDFIPTNGQTDFVLSAIPTSNVRIWLFINNISYLVSHDFTVSANTITWLDSFTLQTTDKIRIKYAHN